MLLLYQFVYSCVNYTLLLTIHQSQQDLPLLEEGELEEQLKLALESDLQETDTLASVEFKKQVLYNDLETKSKGTSHSGSMPGSEPLSRKEFMFEGLKHSAGSSVQGSKASLSSVSSLPKGSKASLVSTTPPKGSKSSLVSTTPPKGSKSNLVSDTPPRGSKASLASTTPPKGSKSNLMSETPLRGSKTNLVSTTPPKESKGNLVSTTPLKGSKSNLMSETPLRGSKTNLVSTTPPKESKGNLVSTAPLKGSKSNLVSDTPPKPSAAKVNVAPETPPQETNTSFSSSFQSEPLPQKEEQESQEPVTFQANTNVSMVLLSKVFQQILLIGIPRNNP